MKEYICKEDMRKAITDSISECQGSYEAIKRQHEIIDEMLKLPTVTKADICREFAEKLKSKPYWDDLYNMQSIPISFIDEVLAKMEEE